MALIRFGFHHLLPLGALLLAVGTTGASIPTGSDWHPISPFTNGTECVAISPSNPQIIYAGNLYDGVYKSTDGGRNWTPAFDGLGDKHVYDLAIHPGNPDIVYAATSSSLDRTTDGGREWVQVGPSGYRARAVAIDPDNPWVVYAGSEGDGLIMTSDAGAGWKVSSYPETNVTQIVIDPSESRTVYAFGHRTYRSTDAGQTWAMLPVDYWPTPQQLAIDPQDSKVLYLGTWYGLKKSTDGGQTWAEIEFFRDQRVWGLVVSKTGRTVFASTNGPTYRSDDGGATWTESTRFFLRRLFANPEAGAAIPIFGTGSGFFLYDGSRWTTSITGMPPSSDNVGPIQVDAADPSILYARPGRTTLKSTDGGASWFELPLSPEPYYPNPVITDPYRAGVVYRMEDVMARSADGGTSWTQLEILGHNLLLAFEPPPSRTVYSYGTGGLFKSGDEGRNWQPVSPPVPTVDLRIQGLHLSRHPARSLFLSQGDRLWKSGDSGQTWEEIPVPGTPGSIETDPDEDDTIFLVAENRLYRTTDRGASWIPMLDQARSLLSDPQNPRILYAGSWAEIFRTTDKGETWSRAAPRNGGMEMNALSAAPMGFAALYESDVRGPYRLYSNRFYFPQLANGVSGKAGIRTSITLANILDREAEVEVAFFDSSGRPMAVRLDNGTSSSRLAFRVPPQGTVIRQTSGEGELQVGYACVTASQGVDGTAVFSYSENGVVMSQAGVRASRPISGFDMAADLALPSRDAGVAVVNAENSDAIVRFDFYDQSLKWLAWREFLLPPGGHLPLFVTELFPDLAPGLGRVKVQSTRYLAGVTLRLNDHPNQPFPLDVPSLSTFPVVPFPGNTIHTREGYRGYFPQVGDGNSGAIGMKTRLVLLGNVAQARVTVEFLTDQGIPMPLNLAGLGLLDRHEVVLASGQPVFLETAGTGPLRSGYARITSDQPVGGTAVYIYSENGTKLFETGVPLSSADRRLGLVFQFSNELQTGIALVNAGSRTAEITASLFDRSGNLVATRAGDQALSLPAGGHLAKYAWEIFSEIADLEISQGLIRFDAGEPLSGVTLLQKDDPALPFPADVFLLTAFPILEGLPARD